jgi:hypothetical protein
MAALSLVDGDGCGEDSDGRLITLLQGSRYQDDFSTPGNCPAIALSLNWYCGGVLLLYN